MEPLFLTPYFRPKIWGGRKLDDIFHYDIPEGKVGEAWNFSEQLIPFAFVDHIS